MPADRGENAERRRRHEAARREIRLAYLAVGDQLPGGAGTSDLRNSPAMAIAEGLRALGASVRAYDPTVHPGAITGIETHGSLVSARRDAEALVIGTEWPEFATLDLALLRAAMSGRVIVDARNILDPAAAVRAGFTYTGIGIPTAGVPAAQMAT